MMPRNKDIKKVLVIGSGPIIIGQMCIRDSLIVEDGHVFKGTSIGSTRDVISEIVFNTSMTGYLEVMRCV